MADDKVEIVISVDADQAAAALKNFEQSSVKSLTKVQNSSASTSKAAASGFDAIKGSIAGLLPVMGPLAIAIAVASAAYQAFTKVMNETAEATKLNLQINAALIATDEAGVGATAAVLAYSEALSAMTGVNDDAINNAFILAKSFGLTTEQAQRLTTAAVDLSAATGQDLDSATRLLAQTFDGTLGKAANLGAEFRNLTEAQLKSGAAVDLVTQKYSGSGAAALNTYEGQANRLSNAIDDLFKSLGRTTEVSDGTGVKSFLAGIAEGITSIINRRKDIEETTSTLARVANLDFNPVGQSSKELSTIISELGQSAENSAKKISSMGLGADHTFAQILSSIEPVKKSLQLTGKELEDFNKKIAEAAKKTADLAESGRKFADSIRSSFGSELQTSTSKAAEAIARVNAELLKGSINAKTAADLRLIINRDLLSKLAKQEDDAREKKKNKEDKERKDAIEAAQIYSAKLSRLFEKPFEFRFQKNAFNEIDWAKSGKEFGAAAAGLLNLALQGKDGAKKAVGQVAGGIIGAIFGPEFGAMAESIIGFLSSGKLAGEFVKNFLIAIPDIINGIMESIPAIVSAIIELSFSKDYFMATTVGVTKGIIKMIVGLFEEIDVLWQKTWGAMLHGISDFFAANTRDWGAKISDGFKEGVGKYLSEVGKYFENFAAMFNFDALIDPMNRLINAILDIAGKGGGKGLIPEASGKGGGQGFAKETLARIGLNKGGMVKPLYLASGSDTIPAMLTPGEMVIPRDMVGALGAFLAEANSNPEVSNDTAILAAILAALQAPMIVNAEAKVNQSAFADIILQLNRQNMRMAG
jgi:hypothetical protein